jgi:hypothetical protein
MRKVIVTECVTLDGIMEDPGGGENPNTAAGAFNSGTKKQGNIKTMNSLLPALFFWGERPMRASQKPGLP